MTPFPDLVDLLVRLSDSVDVCGLCARQASTQNVAGSRRPHEGQHLADAPKL